MADEVLDILAAAARRLRVVRAAESAALGGIAAAVGAAACELAWSIARPWPMAAVATCGVPLLLAGLVIGSARLRRVLGLGGPAAWLAAGVLAAAGLAGALSVIAGLHAQWPRILPLLVFVPTGALAGAVASAARGVSPAQAAVYHDVRLGLDERLSTAAELCGPNRRGAAFARCVCRQAAEAARRERILAHTPWRRSRATAGGLALSVLLCLALALLPAWGAAGVARSFERIRARAAELTPATQKDLVETLRKLAEKAQGNPKLLAALKAAAEAAKDELPARMEELETALADADTAEAARIARALLKSMGLADEAAGVNGGAAKAASNAAGEDANRPLPPDANEIVGEGTDKPLLARAYVYDKSYGQVADANAAASTVPASAGAGAFVPLRDAWTAARDRASASLAAGRIPPEYRGLVRKFFELD